MSERQKYTGVCLTTQEIADAVLDLKVKGFIDLQSKLGQHGIYINTVNPMEIESGNSDTPTPRQ